MRETFPRGIRYKKKREECFVVVCVWRIKATRINSGFCNTTRAFFFLCKHINSNTLWRKSFLSELKNTNGDWMRAHILTIFEEFWDDTTRFPSVCGIFFRSALTVGKNVHKQERKEEATRWTEHSNYYAKKRNMGFFICKTLSSEVIFKKGITQWKHYNRVHLRKK